jgi:3-oxoacyl-[acyl-carrier-protein] synthase II
VAITGMSVASALGFEVDAFWHALLEGRSGIRRLENFDPEGAGLPVHIAGEVLNDDVARGAARYEIRDPDRCTELGMYAIGRALEDAGLPTSGEAPLPMDLVVGTGHGTIHYHHEAHRKFLERGYRGVRPTTVVRIMFNRLASLASMRFKLIGANHVVSSACATGGVALGDAFHRIRFGISEAAVAAAADSGLDLATFAAWNRIGVLSRNPDPGAASRPFDRHRDGMVMGEGAAAFVLESFPAAERRGATILAEMVGYGSSSDAKNIVQPDAAGQARAIRAALDSAGLGPGDIDYVNAHGTGTIAADASEARSLHLALGDDQARRIPVSNTKAQLGHLMGATAGVELVAAVRSIQEGVIPACRNLDDPDPECDLNFVRETPLRTEVGVVVKNTFAFGGNNSVVVLRKV